MDWYPEDLDIPIRKPKELLELEQLDPAVLEAMTAEEIHTHIRQTANGLASAFAEEVNGDYDQCVLVVSTALHYAGKEFGGRFGNQMLTTSLQEARQACGLQYAPEEC